MSKYRSEQTSCLVNSPTNSIISFLAKSKFEHYWSEFYGKKGNRKTDLREEVYLIWKIQNLLQDFNEVKQYWFQINNWTNLQWWLYDLYRNPWNHLNGQNGFYFSDLKWVIDRDRVIPSFPTSTSSVNIGFLLFVIVISF